jgi:long-chain acyl-CoA synthetase
LPAVQANGGNVNAPDFTVGWHAERMPDRVAIVMGASGENSTYAQLEERSVRFARALRARGIAAGQHIAILMENNRSYLEVCWAAHRSGLYYTAINSHLLAGEVQYVLDNCGAVALIASEEVADVVAGLDLDRIAVRISGKGDLPGFERYDDVLASSSAEPLDDEREGQEMLYSSGTTGRPKGVRKAMPGLPLGDPTSRGVQITQGLIDRGVTQGTTISLSPAPLYHAAPLVTSICQLRIGGTVVVMERFDPLECLAEIERYRVTQGQFVPTMFVRMLRLPKEDRDRYDLSSLKNAVHAAAPCPVSVKLAMIEWWGPIIDEYYAGTEDVGSTFITAAEWLTHQGSVGRPLEPCYVLDEAGKELPAGESGAIYFAANRTFEYHNDPEKTASVTNDKGWRTMGDVGYLDADGYLYLTDRKAYMIISGGVNIYPQEAENVLAGHPGIVDVAVIGVPDQEMGEAVKAVVQLVDPAAAGPEMEADLLAFCRAELATYKCPRSVDFVAALPRDDSGKLFKRRLRDTYWEGHDSKVI